MEELLAERGLEISYETVRRWVLKFGPGFARRLRRSRPRPSDQWHLDEMVVRISVHVEKALGGASRLEPLHFPLSSPHGDKTLSAPVDEPVPTAADWTAGIEALQARFPDRPIYLYAEHDRLMPAERM